MFVGLALLVEIHTFDLAGHLPGDLLTVVAAFAFSVNAFVIRHILLVMEEDSVAFYNHASSGLGFLGLAIVSGDFTVLADPARLQAAWLPLLGIGILVSISLPLYYVALHRMDVWKLRMFMLSSPLLTALVEWPLWGAELLPMQCLGGAIMLAALAMLIRLEWKTSSSQRDDTTRNDQRTRP
jgi:drug/metabolite transporter (DMT)-like permease